MADNNDWGGDFGDFEGPQDPNNEQQHDANNEGDGWGEFGDFDEAPVD